MYGSLVLPVAFVLLLIAGYRLGEFGFITIGVFVGIWAVLYAGMRALGISQYFVIGQVCLDVVLVFVVFKGDVRIKGG